MELYSSATVEVCGEWGEGGGGGVAERLVEPNTILQDNCESVTMATLWVATILEKEEKFPHPSNIQCHLRTKWQ